MKKVQDREEFFGSLTRGDIFKYPTSSVLYIFISFLSVDRLVDNIYVDTMVLEVDGHLEYKRSTWFVLTAEQFLVKV